MSDYTGPPSHTCDVPVDTDGVCSICGMTWLSWHGYPRGHIHVPVALQDEVSALRSRLDLAIEALRDARDGLVACKTNLLAFGEGHSRCIEEVNRLSNAAGDVWRAIDSALESVAAEIEEKEEEQ